MSATDQIVSAAATLVYEFTWRRAVALLLVLGTVAVALLAYERTTSGFRLNRIEKTAQILVLLEGLEATNPELDSLRVEMHRKLVADLGTALNREPISLRLPDVSGPELTTATVIKFFSAAVPWLVLALIGWLGAWKERGERTAGTLGMLFIAAAVGLVGAVVPTFGAFWVNWFLVPFALFWGPVVLVIWISLGFASRKRAGLPNQAAGA